MSLKSTIQKAAASAFNVVSSLRTTITLKIVTGEVYDPATMTNTPTYTLHSINALVLGYSLREIDGMTILASDRRVIFEYAAMVLVTPTDKVVIEGDTYDIVNVMRDAADASWSLQVRR